MNDIYFLVDIDKCWGCKSCQVACKQEHRVPPGEGNIQVFRIENEQDEKLRCDFVPVFCQHCDDPKCLSACSRGAIVRDEEGLVQIRKGLCRACGACVKACPFGAVFMRASDEGSFAQKCDLCPERRARGFLTSCEQHCLGHVFTSCGEQQKNEFTKGRNTYSAGKVVYVSTRLIGLGKELKD